MAQFVVQDFVESFKDNPSIESIDVLKKSDLLEISKHFKLNVKTESKKADVKKCVLHHYIQSGLLPESVMSETDEKVFTDYDLELKKLEYQMRMKELDVQVRMRELELNEKQILMSRQSDVFDVTKNIRLVPKFNEGDIDTYFLHFEKVAEKCKWPKDAWPMLLQTVLVGKAQEIYATLDLAQSADYDVIKQHVLRAYELVPEAYRQRFRYCKKSENKTYVEYAREKELLFNRWCSSQKVTTYEDLREIVLLEEFKRSIPTEIHTHIDEQRVTSLAEAAIMADDYSLIHKKFTPKRSYTSPKADFQSSDETSDQNLQQKEGYDDRVCYYCKMSGHVIAKCPKLERKNQAKENALTTTCLSTKGVLEGFKSFVTDGYVTLTCGGEAVPVKILRDTGSSQTLLREGVLPLKHLPDQDTVLVHGVGGYKNIPLHDIQLNSNLVNGKVSVGVMSQLPVNGVSLILGNDLAGDRVFSSDPIVSDNIPESRNSGNSEMSEKDSLNMCPECDAKSDQAQEKSQDEEQYDSRIGLESTSINFCLQLGEIMMLWMVLGVSLFVNGASRLGSICSELLYGYMCTVYCVLICLGIVTGLPLLCDIGVLEHFQQTVSEVSFDMMLFLCTVLNIGRFVVAIMFQIHFHILDTRKLSYRSLSLLEGGSYVTS